MYVEGQTLYGICMENITRSIKRWGVINSDFTVTEDTPVGMYVAATEGVFIVDGVLDLVEAADYAIAAAHATLERVDSLIYDASAGTIQVVTGMAAAAPNPTALTADQILLALIDVAHGVTTILNANIHVYAQVVSVGDVFGDATDGEVSISSAINVGTAPKQYKNLTIVSGGTLQGDQNAYPTFIIAKEYIWIKSGGALTNNGRGSAGGAGGVSGANTGSAGGSGLWGAGGNGGSAVGYPSGSGGIAKGSTQLEKALEVSPLSINDFFDEYGGGGGGGGNYSGSVPGGAGGAGGRGGGLIILIAPLLILESGATISTIGNAGSAATGGNSGGGGGGAGGTIIISGITITDSGITKTLTGGAGGAASGTGSAGSAGGSGKSIVRDMPL